MLGTAKLNPTYNRFESSKILLSLIIHQAPCTLSPFLQGQAVKKSHFLIFPLLLVSYEMATYLSTDMYLPALPQMAQDLGISYHLVQLTLTLWFLGSASIQLLVGPLSDCYGRRIVLLSGGVCFVISSLICAISNDINLLLIARFVQGTAVCSAIVAGYAAIHESLEQKQAIQTLAWMSSITILAPAVGPVIGGLILLVANWHFIFITLTVWGGLSILLLAKFMPETNPNGRKLHPLDLKKLLHNYADILKNRAFQTHALTFCCLFGGFIAWISAGAFLVVSAFHYSVMSFTLFQALIFGAFILGTRFVKPILNRIGPQNLIYLGVGFCLTGTLLAALFATIFPQLMMGLIIPLMAYGFGAGLAFSPLNRLAIESCNQGMGLRMAMYSSGISISGVLASTVIMLIYNGQLNCLAYFMAGLAVLAAVIQTRTTITKAF